jgi:hypothetical protein
MRLKSRTTRLTLSVLFTTTDSTRSLGELVVVVDLFGVGNVGVVVVNVSSSLGAAQLVARNTAGSATHKYRMSDLDMSASADAGIANSDVDELGMWILPKTKKFQKSAVEF